YERLTIPGDVNVNSGVGIDQLCMEAQRRFVLGTGLAAGRYYAAFVLRIVVQTRTMVDAVGYLRCQSRGGGYSSFRNQAYKSVFVDCGQFQPLRLIASVVQFNLCFSN